MATDFFSDLAKQRGQDVRRLGRQRQQYEGTLMRAAATKATQDAKWNLRIADRSYMQALNRDRMQQDFALQRGAQEIGARREAATTERGFRREEAGEERKFRTGLQKEELTFREAEGKRGRALPREQWEVAQKRTADDLKMFAKLTPLFAAVPGMPLPEGFVLTPQSLPIAEALYTVYNKQADKEQKDAARLALGEELDDDLGSQLSKGFLEPRDAAMMQFDRDQQKRQLAARQTQVEAEQERRTEERKIGRNRQLQGQILDRQSRIADIQLSSWTQMDDTQRANYQNEAGEADYGVYVEKTSKGLQTSYGLDELVLIRRARAGDKQAQATLDKVGIEWR